MIGRLRSASGESPALRKADRDRITRDPVDDVARHLSAHGGLNVALHAGNGEPPAGSLETIYADFNVASARQSFSNSRHNARNRLGGLFNQLGSAVDVGKRLSGHLNADGALHTGGEHVDTVANRHHPQVGQTWETNGLIELVDNLFHRHAGAPFTFGFELNGGFNHLQRRRVSSRISAAGLAEDGSDFGHGTDELVGLLQHGCSFR